MSLYFGVVQTKINSVDSFIKRNKNLLQKEIITHIGENNVLLYYFIHTNYFMWFQVCNIIYVFLLDIVKMWIHKQFNKYKI